MDLRILTTRNGNGWSTWIGHYNPDRPEGLENVLHILPDGRVYGNALMSWVYTYAEADPADLPKLDQLPDLYRQYNN